MVYSALLSVAYSLRPAGSHLKELSRTQWLTGEEIRAIQFKKLRAMLEHCYSNVPYYHRAMRNVGVSPEDVRSLDDLSRLPPLSKAEIKKDPPKFRSRRVPWGVMEETTSGSTGEPLKFLRSRSTYEWELAASRRSSGWLGHRLGDRWATLCMVKGFGSFRKRFVDAARDLLWRRLRVNNFKISREAMREEARRIVSFRPILLVGAPQSLLEFGRFAQEENASVPVVVSTFERTAPFERTLLADRWGGEVYDRYGSAEARSMSSECSEHRGLHVADELYLLEFVKDGEHVSPGERGRILVTSLCNWAQPFIRYDTGDLSTPMDEECPCGRGLSLMSTVEGRCLEVIEAEDGRLIFTSEFLSWFADVRVGQYQIEQLDRLRTIIRIVPEEGYNQQFGEKIAGRARSTLGAGVEVGIRVMDTIHHYESGKRQVVKSRARFPPL
ncbi:MAG: phenylacetate--CoA ligase family protein [Candidatus Geothermarchaeales archaeon]